MKILFLIMILVFNLIKAKDIYIENDLSEREVLTNGMIENSGLFRIGDILQLSAKIRVSSIDGFSWFSNINGLSSFQRQNWVILLDGQRLGINTFDIVNINMLPINITQIDSVEIFTTPQLYQGIFTDYGLIHIHTKNISKGKSLVLFQSAGNETGDPGPYRNTTFNSPNVERIGSGSAMILNLNNNSRSISLGTNYKGHGIQDWAIQKRINSIYGNENIYDGSDHWIIPEINRYASIENTSTFLKLKTKTFRGEHDFFTSYSHSYKYFYFLKPISREIPVDYVIKHIGIINNFGISKMLNIIYRLHYTNNQLNKYPNELDFDFDWESTNLHTNLENQFSISSYSVKLGIGVDRYILKTDYELSKSFYDIYNYCGAFNYRLTENIIQNIDVMVLLSNGKHALKGASITKWYINPKQTLNLIMSNTQRLVEEDNSLWYWSQLGYDLINTDFTINGDFNKSKTFTIDLIWSNKINDRLTIEISNYYRSFDDIYLEQQYYSFNSEDGSFTSSPLIIHTNQAGGIMGANLSIKSNIKSKIYQYFYYDYQSELYSKEVFKDVMKTIPKHSLNYQLIFSPVKNFSIWTKIGYLSSSEWENYKNISGESYLTINQDTFKYSNTVESSNIIDIGIKKWLLKRKINTNLFLRNVFNQKKLYHPIGADFDLTLYFHITYYPLKI